MTQYSRPEICNIVEAVDKDFKITIMDMFKEFEENISKSFDEVCENTKKQLNKIMKTIQDIKVEMESLKKIQTEVKVQMKN